MKNAQWSICKDCLIAIFFRWEIFMPGTPKSLPFSEFRPGYPATGFPVLTTLCFRFKQF